MQKIIRILLFTFITVGSVACQKDLSFEEGQAGASGSLRMKIDGKQWVADKFAGASIMAGLINISGKKGDGSVFTVTLMDTTARKYTLVNNATSMDSASAAAYSDSNSISNYSYTTNQGFSVNDAGGWVIVSKIDRVNKTISGTFQMKMFKEYDSTTIQITEGVFDQLKYETSLPPASATDTFKVKIDGSSWNAASISSINASSGLAIVANENPINRTVGLMLPSNITPGTYNLDFLTGTYIGLYNPNPTTGWASTSGTVTILEHNTSTKRIRGNFNFIATPIIGTGSATLSEGYFSVTYQ